MISKKKFREFFIFQVLVLSQFVISNIAEQCEHSFKLKFISIVVFVLTWFSSSPFLIEVLKKSFLIIELSLYLLLMLSWSSMLLLLLLLLSSLLVLLVLLLFSLLLCCCCRHHWCYWFLLFYLLLLLLLLSSLLVLLVLLLFSLLLCCYCRHHWGCFCPFVVADFIVVLLLSSSLVLF